MDPLLRYFIVGKCITDRIDWKGVHECVTRENKQGDAQSGLFLRLLQSSLKPPAVE